jgi:hypothetical protein
VNGCDVEPRSHEKGNAASPPAHPQSRCHAQHGHPGCGSASTCRQHLCCGNETTRPEQGGAHLEEGWYHCKLDEIYTIKAKSDVRCHTFSFQFYPQTKTLYYPLMPLISQKMIHCSLRERYYVLRRTSCRRALGRRRRPARSGRRRELGDRGPEVAAAQEAPRRRAGEVVWHGAGGRGAAAVGVGIGSCGGRRVGDTKRTGGPD